MRWLIVCLICSFLVAVITTQDCAPCKCSWERNKELNADCSVRTTGRNNLTEIPDTMNRRVNQLYFTGQSIKILKNDSFATFHNLTSIRFGYNKIETIEKLAFKNLTELSELRLENNSIQFLPDGIFHDLRQITIINLSFNSIAELPKNIFSNLSTLRNLWLYGNKIKFLPVGLFHDMRQIEIISLSINSITELNKQLFSNLSTLKYLSLSRNQIKVLPDGIFQDLRQIEEIHLYLNNITKLQTHLFYNLPRIMRIDISDNKINTIEEGSFSKLPTLPRVYLENNELKKLRINIIDNVQQLQNFDLHANPWHCDEDLCAVMDSVSSSVFYSPTCQTPAETRNKTWKQLLDQFIPDISNYTRNVEHGDTVYIECKHCFVSKIIWKFNSKRILRDHSVDISSISLTSALILSNVTQDDSGYYSCHVQNCATCKIAGAYLNVNYKKPDDEKYTVTDLVPTTSLVTQSTTVEDPADTSTHSSTSPYLIVAVTVLIILIAIGISIFYHQKCRRYKIQQQEPVPSPPLEPGWGFTPRTLHTPDNSNQSPSNHTANNHTSSNDTADGQTTSNNRQNEQTSRDDINDETISNCSRNEQPTSDGISTDETSHLLPLECIQ